MNDLGTTRATLAERMQSLSAQVQRIEALQSEPRTADFAEQAAEREDEETLDAIERAAFRGIALARLAIARIDAGVYGICTGCGEPIEPRRLAALPEAARCMGCSK